MRLAGGLLCFLLNDDVEVSRDAIAAMLSAKAEIVSLFPDLPGHGKGDYYSAFLLRPDTYRAVGDFDEEYTYYVEDDDYRYRLQRYGIEHKVANASPSVHHGSSSKAAMNDDGKNSINAAWRAGRDHFRRKWGGDPGNEKFHTPFGR